ncbi:hypothetical protein [Bacillus changyiensis]|uniref:hypothetical protein n=1 Tax=Bacillus changyiensis TaxID=3004103 RepID=UPI0022E57DE3|nr:hypothetical protein [Bacillus changyiensis]
MYVYTYSLATYYHCFFLGAVHGFQWTSDPLVIAEGLNGIFGPFLTMLVLVIIQMLQAIGYALCSLWILQIAKRLWETIVYPFILIVILPILLFNLSILPEKWVPLSIPELVLYDHGNGWQSLGINLAVLLSFIAVYGFLLFITLFYKKRKGLVR